MNFSNNPKNKPSCSFSSLFPPHFDLDLLVGSDLIHNCIDALLDFGYIVFRGMLGNYLMLNKRFLDAFTIHYDILLCCCP